MENTLSKILNQAAEETEVPAIVWENVKKRISETNETDSADNNA